MNFNTHFFVLCFFALASIFAIWNIFNSKKNRNYWITSAIFLCIGLMCFILGEIYKTVDVYGVVHQFGPILPIGAALLCIGIIIMIALLIFGNL